MKNETTETTEEISEEVAPGPILTRLIIARNYVRKHRVAFFAAGAATGLALVTMKSNQALRSELDDCESELMENEAIAELSDPTIEDAVVIEDTNEEVA
jgi:hypothetical protein